MPSIIDAFPTSELIQNAIANATYEQVEGEMFAEVTLDADLFESLLSRLKLLEANACKCP